MCKLGFWNGRNSHGEKSFWPKNYYFPTLSAFQFLPTPPKKKKGTVFLSKYVWFQFWERLFFHWTHKEAIFKSHTHSAVGLTVAGLNQESLAPEPHALFIRVANSHGPPGRERIATEGGTLDPAASVRICPHPPVCWWSEGRAGPDVHPSHCHPGILKWPLLPHFPMSS